MLRTSHRVPAFLLGAALAACTATDDGSSLEPPPPASSATVPADLAADSRIPITIAWDDAGVRPRMFTGEFPVDGATAEAAARRFLSRHARRLGLDAATGDLTFVTTRRGLAGTYVRFQQQVAGVPVFDHQVVVAVSADRRAVRAVNLGLHGPIAVPLVSADRGPVAAIAAARAHLGPIVEDVPPTAVRGIDATARPRLAYRVTVAASSPPATWEVTVDAATSAVLAVRDRNAYVDGSGLVYDVTPVASTGDQTLTDMNDNTSPALDAARIQVTLPNLDGTGVLRGPWADVHPLNPAGRADEQSLQFAYDRGDDHFEEVVVYYHLDRAQTRIQALGFADINHRVQVARVNAMTADNSFYSPANKELRFGTGGVDDAEDGDIVLHEYGHSIHDDQVPGWGGGDERAMGEGFGDYLAASFSETLPAAHGHPQLLGQYPCVGDWDAVSYSNTTPKCLRRTDGSGHVPEHTVGQVHADGTLWSAGLWKARTAVGAAIMDTLVLESHFLLSTNEDFNRAAIAIVLADQMVYAGAHEVAVRRALYEHGLLRVPRPSANHSMIVASQQVLLENPHDLNGFYPNDVDHTTTFTRPGSLALRVHFANIELMAAGDCNGGSCDNLYLTDGNGDLYQIFTQLENGPRTSVQVPGDTVKLRLVSDHVGQGLGYVVDRVEALGGVEQIDAAVDAPIDAPTDAAVDAAIDAPTDAAIDAPTDAAIDARPIDAAPPADAAVDARTDAATPPRPDDDGGCCSTGAAPSSSGALGLLVAGLLVRRRRVTGPARRRLTR